ncbi:MAG: magnesium transporter CorA family protein [Chitinophagales bacterium]
MISYYKKTNGKLEQLAQPEEGCWINLYGPFAPGETQQISEKLSIDIDFITDSLDIDERSRYESEDDVDLIVLKTPVENNGISDSEALYITIPIGIIRTPENIITVSAYKNQVIDFFIESPPRNFTTADVNGFILSVFDKNVRTYQDFLKQINYKRYAVEKALYSSSENQDLTNLLNIQKSLIYFVTNLRTNELLKMKIKRSNFLRMDEEKMDWLDDIIIENSQALEMSDLYSNILNGTMDTFASIISNNLNIVMKRLTSVTIVLMVPTLIASFYGMNVTHLPFASHPYSFVIVFTFSIILALAMTLFFVRKKWF